MNHPYTVALIDAEGVPTAARIAAETRFAGAVERALGGPDAVASALRAFTAAADSRPEDLNADTVALAARWHRVADQARQARHARDRRAAGRALRGQTGAWLIVFVMVHLGYTRGVQNHVPDAGDPLVGRIYTDVRKGFDIAVLWPPDFIESAPKGTFRQVAELWAPTLSQIHGHRFALVGIEKEPGGERSRWVRQRWLCEPTTRIDITRELIARKLYKETGHHPSLNQVDALLTGADREAARIDRRWEREVR